MQQQPVAAGDTFEGTITISGKGTGYVKIREKGITIEEAKRFLKPEPIISSIQKGSVVELISGPFKGERAKVVRIDESREEVVLELIEAAVPIPVTVKADQIRIIQKEAD